MDASRTGKAVAVAEGAKVGGDRAPTRSPGTARASPSRREDTGNTLAVADTPTGFFAKVDPCVALAPGERLAPRQHGAAGVRGPRVRRRLRHPRGRARPARRRAAVLGFAPWRAWWWSVAASAGWPRAVRLAKLGHEVTLSSARRPSAARFARRAGRLHLGRRADVTLLPAVIRDLFRKSGRPVERELELVPLDVVREHRFEDGTSVGAARRLAGRPDRRVRRARRRARAGAGWTTSASYADDWEVLRRGYLEGPVGPRRTSPASSPRGWTAARCCTSGCAGRSGTSGCGWSPATRSSPRATTCATCPPGSGVTAYVEQRFGAWTVAGGMAALGDGARRPAGDPQGHRADRHRGRDLVCATAGSSRSRTAAGELDADVVVCAIDPRRLPALAGVRRAHDAGDPAGGRPPRARRRRPGPAARGGAARRPDAGRPHRRHAPRGRARLDRARPRPARRGPAARAGPAPDRRPRRRSSPASTARRATWSSGGAARRWACCGRAARPCGTGSGPTRRSPGVYAAGAHATRGGRAAVRRAVRRAGRRRRSARPDARERRQTRRC